MTQLQYSASDSSRFGLVIYRAKTTEIDWPAILDQILTHQVDTAIIRIPTEQLSQIHKIDRTAMPMMITDSLAYYQADLEALPSRPLQHTDIRYERATPNHHAALNTIVRETFGDYVNHYRMNPFFDNEQVTEGYQDWVRSYAEESDARVCWLLYRGDEVVGFANFNFEKEDLCEGILYGVKPSKRGGGVFRDIMLFAMDYARQRGYTKMMVTTQVENRAVQRVWSSLGFQVHHHDNTIHVNAMLTKSVFVPFTESFHFEPNELRPAKLTNRLLLEQINHYFDLKQNMLTQNHRYVNISPMVLGQDYKLHFSFPTGSKGLLRVVGQDGKIYVLVYFDLKHFVA